MVAETLLLAGLAVASAAAAPASSKPPLQFTADGKFHISVFNDFHFGENAAGQGPAWDIKTAALMGTVLDAESPQLVVLNGDLITGDQYKGKDILDHVDRLVKPVVERRLPWASTYGNHDSDYNLSREKMYKREKTYNGSYTERMVQGDKAGVTNYYLPVYAADDSCQASAGNDCLPELLLWFFDSRGGRYYRTHDRQPNWVDASVVEWFNDTSKQLADKYGRVVPSLAFVHIPIHVTVGLQKQGPDNRIDLARHPGIDDDAIHGQAAGWSSDGQPKPDKDDYGAQDIPFMQALVDAQGLMGLFYGHDHGNTWCYRWNGTVADSTIRGRGLHLCYGQHTGYGGYGSWIRGGRQIVVSRAQLQADRAALDTHIRLETGDVVGSVTLNSTFNNDVYPIVPDTKTTMPLQESAGSRVGLAAVAALAPTLLTCLLLWNLLWN